MPGPACQALALKLPLAVGSLLPAVSVGGPEDEAPLLRLAVALPVLEEVAVEVEAAGNCGKGKRLPL